MVACHSNISILLTKARQLYFLKRNQSLRLGLRHVVLGLAIFQWLSFTTKEYQYPVDTDCRDMKRSEARPSVLTVSAFLVFFFETMYCRLYKSVTPPSSCPYPLAFLWLLIVFDRSFKGVPYCPLLPCRHDAAIAKDDPYIESLIRAWASRCDRSDSRAPEAPLLRDSSQKIWKSQVQRSAIDSRVSAESKASILWQSYCYQQCIIAYTDQELDIISSSKNSLTRYWKTPESEMLSKHI